MKFSVWIGQVVQKSSEKNWIFLKKVFDKYAIDDTLSNITNDKSSRKASSM